MADAGSGANRIELESQILCASLRQSWAAGDVPGVITVARQLFQLFPDLLPPLKSVVGNQSAPDLYRILGLSCDAPQSLVVSSYIRAVKEFNNCNGADISVRREEYNRLLNIGYILRKPRLRLSHDLIAIRSWLLEQKAIPEDGSIEFVQPIVDVQPAQFMKTMPLMPNLPVLVDLLRKADIIGVAEVQALSNQMSIAPEIPIQELVLSAGYVSEPELKSLQLAEYLLSQGKITIAQFIVAMYDERHHGVRMAESLQIRGWVETEVKSYRDERK